MAILTPGNDLFLDTSYAIALSSPSDAGHGRAVALSLEIERLKPAIVTTRPVLIEIGNALAKPKYRSAAGALISAVETDERITVVPLTDELFDRAFQLFIARPDKEWGLTDCVSFIVMGDRKLREALTADKHFEQAGFRALLRDPPD